MVETILFYGFAAMAAMGALAILVSRNIVRYKEQKARKYVTLNEEKFLKERAELSADREEEKAIEKRSEESDGAIKRDYYLDEVLAITTDYLKLEHVATSAQASGATR
jgi:hypothetical protein